jgi:hypothetical protein
MTEEEEITLENYIIKLRGEVNWFYRWWKREQEKAGEVIFPNEMSRDDWDQQWIEFQNIEPDC